jgi:hypothetical protein
MLIDPKELHIGFKFHNKLGCIFFQRDVVLSDPVIHLKFRRFNWVGDSPIWQITNCVLLEVGNLP